MMMIGGSPNRTRVLIADDDPSTRMIMREVLEQAEFDVLEVEDGKEALRCYESSAPDIILLDVEMPYFNGFDVCEKIRRQETSRQTPICIITGLDDDESVDRAYQVGATDFISKPIAWPALAHRVRYILRANKALNEIQGLMLALPDAVFVLDKYGDTQEQVTEIDRRISDDIGPVQGIEFDEIIPEEDRGRVRKCIERALLSGKPQTHEHFHSSAGLYLETRFVARDRHTVLAIVRDVTERKRGELQIYDLAFYDQLTGLPNRQLFSNELDTLIDSVREQQRAFTIFFVDLDRFKRINDNLGHSTGDELLKAVAKRLQGSLRSSDCVARARGGKSEHVRLARLGGDEFVILLRDVGSGDAAEAVASRIVASLAEPLDCCGHQFVVTPSIGIAIYPQDGSNKDELLMNADSAMYKAKAAGRNTFRFYSETMRVRSLRRLEMEGELRRAINDEDFQLHYQPKVDIESWRIVGAEALLRWEHAENGWIPPADFIPIAEESGLILPLGRWVLQEACRQLAAWRDSPLRSIGISVNISSEQMRSEDFIADVQGAISQSGISAELLDLEITEGLLMRDTEATIEALNVLRSLGVTISVDDFGTGYSSLSYLKRFPIDFLKIDRSFVRDLHQDADDAAICAAILAMARNLDIKVIAEGVELEEHLDFLRRHDCEQLQGYLYSKPLPASEFEALVCANFSPGKVAAR
jgi:diguanylate cyclase (GGDEF)-like protein